MKKIISFLFALVAGGSLLSAAEYVSPISVNDQSVADWENLDPAYVAVANVTDAPYFPALKQVKVYSDGVYINYLLVIDPQLYTSHMGMKDGMHIYLNVDNSDATGGFFDLFADAAVDIMLEGTFFDEEGASISYSPAIYKWTGPEGGQPSERVGNWEDVWDYVGSMEGESQWVGNTIIEGRLLVDLISNKFAEEGFRIGFEIMQDWSAVGLLPQMDAQGEYHEFIGRTEQLLVKFHRAPEGTELNDYAASVAYLGKGDEVLHQEDVMLHVPTAPEIEGFTFVEWTIAAGKLADGFVLQAVYAANEPHGAPEVVTNPSNPSQKLIRQGNVYILTGDRTYTLDGKAVR